jgi:NADH dehydrogenase (ubiquinone) 1 beta subcomplex subunit 8
MISRVGIACGRLGGARAVVNSVGLGSLRTASTVPHTTVDSIVDHTTGRVIKLTDVNRPEIGDYPNPPPRLAQSRDPYAKYDDPQNRRNLNDPVNIDDDFYDMWSPDYFQPVSDKTALLHNGIFFSLIFGFGAAIWYFQLNPEKPAMPRSYPFGGLAKELGSASEETDKFYRVKPDTTAEQQLGFLPDDSQIAQAQQSYEAENAGFIKA